MKPVGEDGAALVLVVVRDIHQYLHVYECLRYAAAACGVPAPTRCAVRIACAERYDMLTFSDGVGLRAWLGLKTFAYALGDYFFGDRQHALAAIDREQKFYDFPASGILQIAKPIAMWGFIACFGKTLMFACVVKMITLHCPKAVVWSQ